MTVWLTWFVWRGNVSCGSRSEEIIEELKKKNTERLRHIGVHVRGGCCHASSRKRVSLNGVCAMCRHLACTTRGWRRRTSRSSRRWWGARARVRRAWTCRASSPTPTRLDTAAGDCVPQVKVPEPIGVGLIIGCVRLWRPRWTASGWRGCRRR